MRKTLRIATVGFVCSTVTAFAGGGNHGGGSSSTSGGHQSSSASSTVSAPSTASVPAGASSRMSGMPHYSGQMPTSYRPTVIYRNGNRSLNYPPVRVSNAPRSLNSKVAGSNSNARVLRHSGGLKHANSSSQRSVSSSSRASDKSPRTSANLQRGSGKPQHTGAVSLNAKRRLDPQASARLRNWRGNASSTAEAQQKNWNNCRQRPNCNWWRNRCIAFIFWDWGWWGWWDGWWYPAWGYDRYSYYGYNEPIYGYGDLSPEQIVASVQTALQERGYYTYAIDGQMGPLTKSAIARYQRDHRLPITYGIDPATLGSLGIVH